jgi:hypothetical protein
MIDHTKLYLALRRHYWRHFPSAEQSRYELNRKIKMDPEFNDINVKQWMGDQEITCTFTMIDENEKEAKTEAPRAAHMAFSYPTL